MSLFCVNELTKVTKECAKMNPFGLPGDHRHYTNASAESVRSEALKGLWRLESTELLKSMQLVSLQRIEI